MFDQLRQASSSIAKHAALRCSRRKRREKGSCGLQEGRKRHAGPFGREKPRHDVTALGDTPEGLGKSCMGAIEHGLEP
jgi:hypothetical protein